MEERDRKWRQRAKDRKQRRLEKESAARRLREADERRKRAKALAAPVPLTPRTTRSFALKAAETRSRLQRREDEAKREAEEQARRCTRELRTGEALGAVMREMNRGRTQDARQEAAREAASRAKESRKRYHQALRENKTRLEQVRFEVLRRERLVAVPSAWLGTEMQQGNEGAEDDSVPGRTAGPCPKELFPSSMQLLPSFLPS